MSRIVRLLLAAVLAVAGVTVASSGIVHASLSANISFTFPAAAFTVGQQDIPVALSITNDNTGTQIGLVNTVCNWDSSSPPCLDPGATGTPASDKGINFVMSCGDLAGVPTTCGIPDPDVFRADAIGIGRAGTACAGRNFDILVSDATYGTLRFTPQGATPFTLAQDATCVIDFQVDVLKVPTVDQDPGTAGIQTAQIADVLMYSAALDAYSSDSSNLTINKASPTIETQASTTVPLGGTISDTAFVSGRVSAAATSNVHFALYGPDNATCAGAPIFTSDVNLPSTQSNVTSASFTPTAVGTYRWIARYDGDANNNAVSGACNDANESVVVTKAAPSIATTASPAQRLGARTMIDTATVSGRVSPVAGGTVDFRLYGPDDATCSNTPVFTSLGVVMPTTSDVVTSAAFTPLLPGTYRWIASYSGDANNLAASGACNDANESTVVTKAQPVITTDAGPNVAIGSALSDRGTITGRVSPLASTVDFMLYGPDDDTCAGPPVFEALGVVLAPGSTTVTSPSFTPTIVGTYRWIARYNGDANNDAVAGICGEPTETVDVVPGSPRIITQASPGVRVGGGVLFDTATVTGRIQPQAGATIDFRLYGPGDTTCTGAPVFTSLGVPYPAAGGPVTSARYTPTVIGVYRWVATYSGDANNAPAVGVCGDPAETVEVVINPDVQLPATGSETGILVQTGAGMLLAGLAFLGLGTRRRRPTVWS